MTAKPSLNTHQLPAAGAWTHAHNLWLSRPLYTCRLVTEIRGGPRTKPCCASVMHSPLHPPPPAAILWSFKSRRWSLNRDCNTGAASSSKEPAKKKRIWNKKKSERGRASLGASGALSPSEMRIGWLTKSFDLGFSCLGKHGTCEAEPRLVNGTNLRRSDSTARRSATQLLDAGTKAALFTLLDHN